MRRRRFREFFQIFVAVNATLLLAFGIGFVARAYSPEIDTWQEIGAHLLKRMVWTGLSVALIGCLGSWWASAADLRELESDREVTE